MISCRALVYNAGSRQNMLDSIIESASANERISVCYSLSVLALNAVFCTSLRDGLPEWSRVSPFDCLHATFHHTAVLLVQTQANRVTVQNDYNRNSADDDQQSTLAPQRRQMELFTYTHVNVCPGPLKRLLRLLNVTAMAAFLLVITRLGYPWAKTFAIMYLLYWIGPTTLFPARPILMVQVLRRRSDMMTNAGFIFGGHILIWYLWSYIVDIDSINDYWLALLTHCGVAVGATAVACVMPGTLQHGTGEFLAYLVHTWAFTMAWGNTYFASLLHWHTSLWLILGYDLAFFAFALAKGQHVMDPHRWPAGVLASCLLLVIIIEIQGQGFYFESSPRSRDGPYPAQPGKARTGP